MLRIDEIYNNTFWPWFRRNRSGVRMFMCDPFGRSDPDSVKNYGSEIVHEYNYIFFFDQEPIHLNVHIPTFEEVKFNRNPDLHNQYGDVGYLMTSVILTGGLLGLLLLLKILENKIK